MAYNDTAPSGPEIKSGSNTSKKLSLCMIVKNEENFLEQCLTSAADIVDEIVILDTGSTDGTIKIAEKFNAKIYHFSWSGDFSEARNKALEYVTGDWVLQLDADEEIADENKSIIRQLILREEPIGYLIKIVNFINMPDGNREIIEHYAMRLFPKHPDIFYRQPLHEQISYRVECLDGAYNVLPLDRSFSPLTIYHHGYHKQLVKDRNKTDRNTKILKDILQKENKNAFQHFNLGLALAEEEKYEEALKEYLTAAELEKPEISYYPMILVYSSYLCTKLGRYDEGLKHAMRAVEVAPKLSDAVYILGEAYRYTGKTEEAILQYKKALQIYNKQNNEEDYNVISDPGTGTWKPLNQIGSIYFRLGEHEKAFEYLEKAISIKPDSLCTLHNLGNLHLRCLEMEKAEEMFKRAYNVSWKSSYEEVLNCYLLQKKWIEADAFLLDLQKNLSLIEWLSLEAKAAMQMQNWQRARVALETLISQKPSAVSYTELGMIYVREGSLKEGENAYKEAIKLEPSCTPARFNLSQLLFSIKNYEEALLVLEPIQLNNTIELQTNLLRAHILAAMNKINESNTLLLELNKLHPESQEAVLLLCDNLIKIKADDTAYELLSMIQPRQKENPEFLLKHGLTALRLKKYDKAKKLLSEAQTLSPSSEMIKIVMDALSSLTKQLTVV